MTMDAELEKILDRGLNLKELWKDGEFQGTDWKWKDHLEQALLDYFKRHLGEATR